MASAIFSTIAKTAISAIAGNVFSSVLAPKPKAPSIAQQPQLLQSTEPTAQQKADADAAAEEVKAKEEAAATEAQRTELLRVSKKKGRQSTILATNEDNQTTGNLLGG